MTEYQADEIIRLLKRSNDLLEAIDGRISDSHRDLTKQIDAAQFSMEEAARAATHDLVENISRVEFEIVQTTDARSGAAKDAHSDLLRSIDDSRSQVIKAIGEPWPVLLEKIEDGRFEVEKAIGRAAEEIVQAIRLTDR